MSLLHVAIIQARTGSLRFPEKILKNLSGKPLLWHVIERAKKCKQIQKVIVATTLLKEDLPIQEITNACGVECFQGSEENVLERYYQAAEQCNAKIIARLTSDCPLIEPATVDEMVVLCQKAEADYVCHDPFAISCESGAEVFQWDTLKRLYQTVGDSSQKEHVTLYLREHPEGFKIALLQPDPALQKGDIRLTVDHAEDFQLIEAIYNEFYQEGKIVDLKEVVKWLDLHPEWKKLNQNVALSEVNQYVTSDEIKKRIKDEATRQHEL